MIQPPTPPTWTEAEFARRLRIELEMKKMKMKAHEILQAGIDAMESRAAERDKPDSERSMPHAVEIYRAVKRSVEPTVETEADGWLFMVCLKLARSRGGAFLLDDWIDMAAYVALTGEALAADEMAAGCLVVGGAP